MGRRDIYMVSAIAMLFLFSYGCKKDRTYPSIKKVYSTPDTYLNSRKKSEQVFNISDQNSLHIVGRQGTSIYFNKETFSLPDGSPVDYPYVVKLVELYKPYDMIYYKAFPVSDGVPLITQGEVRISAEKDNVPLALRPGTDFKLEFPANNIMQNMYLFLGAGEPLNWEVTEQMPDVYVDTLNSNNTFYRFAPDTLGWFACSKLMSYDNLCDIRFVSLTDSVETLFKVVYLPEYSLLTHSGPTVSVPRNADVHFLALGVEENGTLCYFYKEFVSQKTTIDITMEPVSYDVLDNLIVTKFDN